MSLSKRVTAVENFLIELKKQRESIIELLMWEIGKNEADATSEFDRTIEFAQQVIDVVKSDPEFGGASWQSIGATRAFVRRAAIGIILCLGPYNYPLNETYATLIPALLMGNIVILKIPTIGGLSHLLTMDAFSKALPPGTIHFVSGRGRATMPPLMESGAIDGLAFIGGSNAADTLIKDHPHPHRLKVFLQLEAKNMGIFLEDLFDPKNAQVLDTVLDEAVLGSLSFNGQRCTALKIMFAPSSQGETVAKALAERVERLPVGLPWQKWDNGSLSKITPLPNQNRIDYMKSLIDDATSKGAKVMNKDGGTILGGSESTLMVPAVLYPVTPDMKIYSEEQFGPIVPIATYDKVETVLEYGRDGEYGQQVSVFTAQQSTEIAANLLDNFSSVFGKININGQCGRSPDTLPFSGRRSSAMGVMSVRDALLEFSIPTVVAYKDKGANAEIVGQIEKSSSFMQGM
jgi:glyceraldehyde-3-phosphate dehydrogenase (NADP+)